MPLATTVVRGFNNPKPAARTGMLSVDISKAFDLMPRHLLLEKLGATDLHSNLKRWYASYFADRRMKVVYQGAVSKWKKSKLGVVQGGPDSPPLWNLFTKDHVAESADVDEKFADDFHSAAVSPDLDNIAATLNVAAEETLAWATDNEMTISAQKSTVTVFTPWTKQVNAQLEVKIGDDAVPTEKHPRLLGVLFDPLWTFSHHAIQIARRANSKMNVIRALSDSEFGKDKECLLLTFKTFIRPILNYAAPVTYPNYAASSIEKLQRVQNRALRLALGCHSAASVDHLHAEAKELLVADHLRLLASQFLAKALHPDHISHHYVKLDRGRRSNKHTLQSKCIDDVRQYLDEEGNLPRGSYNEVKNNIHTDIVREALNRSSAYRVLGRRPPEISNQETYLPRLSRVTLSQLRSGHCARLRDYQFYKLKKVDDDLCLECRSASESVHHLFSCNSHPTNLTVVDLWKRPWEVICHLTSFPSFNFLPHPGPPPPPPVRRRRRPPIPPDPSVSPDRQDRPDSPGLQIDSSLFSPLSLPPATPPLVIHVTPNLVNSNPPIPPLMRPQARSSRSNSISSDNDT